ncbi:hypothetical protein PPROV_001039300 [Pycnococcus provasolii]|uniref:Uncharacterized protein n=1 Tax=Pycnococcus provasolii TaxID=41880 RepID=A0A830HYK6_9CHLO|nr:hypothetical protein PPROV_001039300 [Pycnococcus provasolii]
MSTRFCGVDFTWNALRSFVRAIDPWLHTDPARFFSNQLTWTLRRGACGSQMLSLTSGGLDFGTAARSSTACGFSAAATGGTTPSSTPGPGKLTAFLNDLRAACLDHVYVLAVVRDDYSLVAKEDRVEVFELKGWNAQDVVGVMTKMPVHAETSARAVHDS